MVGTHARFDLFELLKFKHGLVGFKSACFRLGLFAVSKLSELVLGGDRAGSSVASWPFLVFALFHNIDGVCILLHLVNFCKDAVLVVDDRSDWRGRFVRHAICHIVLSGQILGALSVAPRVRSVRVSHALKLVDLFS